ncbi:class I SAM-dependent methyltransferase [Halocatena marina]|uniref:class I SAM-dependent methyltransferase n=1 Tax=Halocatena marina TaxID=2934937 RepID=UPI00200F3592|nr:class I SAM-dependent methyltransferase [Halocatena marina]
MTPLSLNDLPRHSEWAAYLLDASSDPPTDPEMYTKLETYDDIYAYLLKRYHENPIDYETFIEETRSLGRNDPDVISIDEALYFASSAELLAQERSVIRDALRPALGGDETVVDLGCGWGATLGVIADTFPNRVIGGEYSEHGVELARELSAGTDRISVEQFDFHGDWDLLDGNNNIIFTCDSLTAIASVETVVDRLASCVGDGEIIGGVHLEPVGPHPDTMLGLLRRQYAKVRNYNTDVLSAIGKHQNLSVTTVEYDSIGANPLHPLTTVRWQAKQE